MNRLNIPATIVAITLAAPMAMAGPMLDEPFGDMSPAYGLVASWNAKSRLLRLANGTQYILPKGYASATAYKWGEMVKVVFRHIGPGNYATSVTVLPKEKSE